MRVIDGTYRLYVIDLLLLSRRKSLYLILTHSPTPKVQDVLAKRSAHSKYSSKAGIEGYTKSCLVGKCECETNPIVYQITPFHRFSPIQEIRRCLFRWI